MSTLTDFSQGTLLRNTVTDPLTRNGICVALCDYWLKLIKTSPSESPADRLLKLRAYFIRAMQHQRLYSGLRSQHGREEARRQVGAQLGLNYSDQTMILRTFVGMGGIKQKLGQDLSRIGAAATWTLRFADGGGHAIAGFCGLSGQPPIMRHRLHIFDPNIGEYEGTVQELNDMLDHLFRAFPMYATVTGVHRTSET